MRAFGGSFRGALLVAGLVAAAAMTKPACGMQATNLTPVPPILPVSSPASLNFAAGATTGNTLTITLLNQGCDCGGYWTTSIDAASGTTMAANAPTVTTIEQPSDFNGNAVYQVVIGSAAPSTTGLLRRPGWMEPGISVALAAGLLPLAWRRRRLGALAAVGILMLLPGLSGCGTGIVETRLAGAGSAGSYVVTVSGIASTLTSSSNFSLQVPVTIQ